MTAKPTRARTFGWLTAGVSSAAILSGAAALALAAESRVESAPMQLDLSMLPATAPNVAAVAEDAPQVLDEVTQQSEPPEVEPPPELETDTAPDLPMQSALSLPQIDKPVVADLNLPPPPEEPVKEPEKKVEEPKKAEKKPEKKPDPKPKKKAAKKVEKPEERVKKDEKPKKEETSQATAKAGANAAKAGKAKGGASASPKAYQKSVYKKVQRKFKAAKGKGTATVNFTVSASGSLAGAQLAQSSGNAAVDKAALDAVRRAGPFGPTPSGKAEGFSLQLGVR